MAQQYLLKANLKGDKLVIERTTYTDVSPEGGPGENIINTPITEKELSNDITYVTPDKLNKEVIIGEGKTDKLVPGVLKKTVEKIKVIKEKEETKESLNNDSFKQIIKFGAEKVGGAIGKIFKKK